MKPTYKDDIYLYSLFVSENNLDMNDTLSKSRGMARKKLAYKEEEHIYEGQPCEKCGGTKRFTNLNDAGHTTGECMACRAERKVRYRAAKIQRTPPWFNDEHKKEITDMIQERDRLEPGLRLLEMYLQKMIVTTKGYQWEWPIYWH